MNRDEIVERLCKLCAEIYRTMDPACEHSNDCFCGKGGFWGLPSYGGVEEEGYRNDGYALRFIEDTVREKLNVLVGSDRCICNKCGQPHDPKLHSAGEGKKIESKKQWPDVPCPECGIQRGHRDDCTLDWGY